MSETMMFIFSLIITGLFIFLFVFFIITLSDLDCDYINSQQCCSRLNMWVLPKLGVHTFLTILLLLYSRWTLALVNVPLAIWLVYEYCTVPRGNVGVYDPVEIHNRGQLSKFMKHVYVYIGFYLILFFCYLYSLISLMLKDNPLERDTEMSMFED